MDRYNKQIIFGRLYNEKATLKMRFLLLVTAYYDQERVLVTRTA